MGLSLPRPAALVAALALLCGAGSAPASEILIQYDLTGNVNLRALAGVPIDQPVFSSSAPGPGGVGSKATFRFVTQPSGQTSVQLLTFAQSNAMTTRSLTVSAQSSHLEASRG